MVKFSATLQRACGSHFGNPGIHAAYGFNSFIAKDVYHHSWTNPALYKITVFTKKPFPKISRRKISGGAGVGAEIVETEDRVSRCTPLVRVGADLISFMMTDSRRADRGWIDGNKGWSACA